MEMSGQVKILPVSDLRSNATNYLEQVKEQPFIITQRGRPRAVLVDYERYSQIAEGIEDAAVYTFRQLVSEMQAMEAIIVMRIAGGYSIWTVADQLDEATREQLYGREWELMQLYPDLNFDFHLLERQGRDLEEFVTLKHVDLYLQVKEKPYA
jgi:prevent-host-death family protein